MTARRLVWTGVALVVAGGLVLWWRFGLPVGLANAVWLCVT